MAQSIRLANLASGRDVGVAVGAGAGGAIAAGDRDLAAGEIVCVLRDVPVLIGFRDYVVVEVVGLCSPCARWVVSFTMSRFKGSYW